MCKLYTYTWELLPLTFIINSFFSSFLSAAKVSCLSTHLICNSNFSAHIKLLWGIRDCFYHKGHFKTVLRGLKNAPMVWHNDCKNALPAHARSIINTSFYFTAADIKHDIGGGVCTCFCCSGPVFDCVHTSIRLHNKYHRVPNQLLKQLGAQWKWLVDMWKPNTAHFLSDHHRPRFHSAALLNCKKNNSSCHGCSLVCSFPVGTPWNGTLSSRMWCLIPKVNLIWKWWDKPLGLAVAVGEWRSKLPNFCFSELCPAWKEQGKERQTTRPQKKKSLWAGKCPDRHRKTWDSLMGIGEGFPRRAEEHPLLSHSCLLHPPCCGWPPRYGCLRSTKCPWPYRCCRFCPGPERGGQASQSPTPGRQQGQSELSSDQLSSAQVRGHDDLIYLWIELIDVATLFTQVEELKDITTNK